MTWRFDRKTGHVLDEAGAVVADAMPEHGEAIAALPELLAACERAELEGGHADGCTWMETPISAAAKRRDLCDCYLRDVRAAIAKTRAFW
jgi:hypothetical protein